MLNHWIKLSLAFVILLSGCGQQLDRYELVHVIDGDSLMLRSYGCSECKAIEVRLIGIDAPEYKQEQWGQKARDFVVNKLSNSQGIYLEQDAKKFDKYNRYLGYIFYDNSADKRVLLNSVILKHGLAEIFSFAQNKTYLTEFKLAQAEAQKAELNIWDPVNGLKERPFNYRKRKNREKAKR